MARLPIQTKTLRRTELDGSVTVREITLFRETDERYAVAINTFKEGEPTRATIADHPAGPTRQDAFVAFQRHGIAARNEGFKD